MASSTIFESLVWLNLGLNPGLPDHWQTLYSLDQWHTTTQMITDNPLNFNHNKSPKIKIPQIANPSTNYQNKFRTKQQNITYPDYSKLEPSPQSKISHNEPIMEQKWYQTPYYFNPENPQHQEQDPPKDLRNQILNKIIKPRIKRQ